MYIELFLADNFIFDMLILRCASAVTHLRFSIGCACIVCTLLSVYSAFAVNIRIMQCFPAKGVLLLIFSLPFYVNTKKFSAVSPVGIVFSTLLLGGAVYVFSNGILRNASAFVRLFLYPAFAMTFLPSVLRHIRLKNTANDCKAILKVYHNDTYIERCGIFDSGCLLCEPLSGIPVILVYAPELAVYAHLPLSYSDTANTHSIKVFIPERVEINGYSVTAYIAPLTERAEMPAVIPYVFKSVCNSLFTGRNVA